jgi:hypothetical protein
MRVVRKSSIKTNKAAGKHFNYKKTLQSGEPLTMSTNDKLELISSFDFGVYTTHKGYAIADPLDDEDGFYLAGDDLDRLCDDAIEHLQL